MTNRSIASDLMSEDAWSFLAGEGGNFEAMLVQTARLATQRMGEAYAPPDYMALFNSLVRWDYVEPSVQPKLYDLPHIQWHERLFKSIEKWKVSLPSGLGPRDYVYLCLVLDCSVPVLEAIFYNAPLHKTGHIPSHFFERLEKRPDLLMGNMLWEVKSVYKKFVHSPSPRFNRIDLDTMKSTNELLRALFK